MVFSLQLASKSIDNLSWAFVTIRGTKHCPWIASSCSNLLQFFTNSVSQSWSASTNHDVLEISIQDGLFPKDVLRKQQRRALIAMQQCTHIKLNYSAKFSHLTKTKTKRWFKARTAYYPNSVATFNFNALTISLSGDVHPLPGPISRGTWLCKIPARCTHRKKKTTSCSRTCDESNCIKIYSKRSNSSSLSQSLDFCLWNVRSVKNKALSLKDYTVEHDLDFLALTETWLHSGEL